MNKTDSLLRTCVVPVQTLTTQSRLRRIFDVFIFRPDWPLHPPHTELFETKCLLVNWLDICVTFLVEVSVNGFANELNICLFSCVASIHIHFESVCDVVDSIELNHKVAHIVTCNTINNNNNHALARRKL